jgi:hypothetical protein
MTLIDSKPSIATAVDGVPVSVDALRKAEEFADATGKRHYVGFEWEWMPSERKHRDSERSVITDSYEVIKASCGWFVHVPPMRGVR